MFTLIITLQFKELSVTDLTMTEASRFLGISLDRVRFLGTSGRIKSYTVPCPWSEKGITRTMYPLSELKRIKPILDNPEYCGPGTCLVCGKIFERKDRRVRICQDCQAITKECDCGCGAIIPKYVVKVKGDKPIINKYDTSGLSTHQAAKFLGISPERTRRLAEHRRISIHKTTGGHRRYPISELERIKPFVDVEVRTCDACGKPFESIEWDFICPACRSITKKCECSPDCDVIIPKYGKHYSRDHLPINRYAQNHGLNAYRNQLRQDPEAWREWCQAVRDRWQDPEFREKTLQGRIDSTRDLISKVRDGYRTDIERITDTELERLGIEFEPDYRVSVFYIDCAILSHKVAIECDGDYFHSLPDVIKQDAKKDRWLKENGWTVVRLTGSEIGSDIQKAIEERVLPHLN
jgi:excisionase family DNA binding protein